MEYRAGHSVHIHNSLPKKIIYEACKFLYDTVRGKVLKGRPSAAPCAVVSPGVLGDQVFFCRGRSGGTDFRGDNYRMTDLLASIP